MSKTDWQTIGDIEVLKTKPLQEIVIGKAKIALTYLNGSFAAVSGFCNHFGGPLGRGKLSGEYVVCPWHNWKFHHKTGKGEPGFEADCVPTYSLKTEGDNFVHWADVVVIATPIRWGNASSLYYKMVERMNCVQNQITIANRQLIANKVVSLIITGGQDNIQAVAGQLLGFFAEIGCSFPPFPYIAHSRGWTAGDMEQNVIQVANSKELREGAEALVTRSIETV